MMRKKMEVKELIVKKLKINLQDLEGNQSEIARLGGESDCGEWGGGCGDV